MAPKTHAELILTVTAATLAGSAAAPNTAAKAAGERRGQTLRLAPEAWRQLKVLAIDQGKPSHDLLIEAVNLLFDKYNLPRLAGCGTS